MKNGTLGCWLMKRLDTLWLWRRKEPGPSEPQDKVQISADNWDLLPGFGELNNEAMCSSWTAIFLESRKEKIALVESWRTKTHGDCNSPTVLISLWPLREKIWHQRKVLHSSQKRTFWEATEILSDSPFYSEPVILFYLENTSFGSFH